MAKKNQPKKISSEVEKTFRSGEVMSLLENMNEGIHVIAESQTEVIRRLDGLEGRMDTLETKVDTLEVKMDHLQDDMTDVKYKLSEKVDISDFKKLEKRVVKIEGLAFSKAR
jgi:chaperonin cofactor prefoldin